MCHSFLKPSPSTSIHDIDLCFFTCYQPLWAHLNAYHLDRRRSLKFPTIKLQPPHILSSSAVKLMQRERTVDNTCPKRCNDSYRTSHPITLYCISQQMAVFLNKPYTNICYTFKYKITLFLICVSLTLIPVTFLLKITISFLEISISIFISHKAM